jgi:hypothetical protein
MFYTLINLSSRMIFSQPDQNNTNLNDEEIDIESTGQTIITDTTENNTTNNILLLDGDDYMYTPERMREILIYRYE